MAATVAGICVTSAIITASAAAVAECREYEKYDDPYPDVSVFKNIAKAVHFVILLVFGIPFRVLCYYLMVRAKMCDGKL